jgi:hypothetical protein
MTEEFLHYIWRHRQFKHNHLKLTNGEALEIIYPGNLNTNAGPDFSEARIKIDNQEWAGMVEIHLTSVDWFKHGHQEDKAYQAVILHVVYEDNKPVHYANGQPIPTLILKDLFDESFYWRYEQLLQTKLAIPCQNNVASLDSYLKLGMQERALVERLRQKQTAVLKLLQVNKGDWRLTYYHWFSSAFGLKVNTQPMLMLAQQINPEWVMRLNSQTHQAEALFLGMAGFLQNPADPHSKQLKQEFKHLQNKYQITPLTSSIWKYSRLRPPAFPEFRIALLAAFWQQKAQALDFNSLLHQKTIDASFFKVSASPYWQNHYRLGKPSASKHPAKLGTPTANSLIINVLAPFSYAFKSATGQNNAAEQALQILAGLPAEKNKVTRIYQPLGFLNQDAAHSQGLIALHKNYCQPKKCLRCALGIKILKV